MKILVVAPSWIGDTVLAQPLFRLLQERHPGLALDVIAPPWTLPLLRRMPEVRVASAHGFTHGALQLGERFRFGRRLTQERYDRAIILPNTLKSALVALFAGIPQRTGYRGESRWLVLNDLRNLDEKALPQIAQRYAALGLPAGAPLPDALPLPHLECDGETRRQTLAQLKLEQDHGAVAFCPGAEYGPAKRWPAPYYAELARKLAADGRPVWLIGSANDAAVGEEIERLAPGTTRNLCGRTILDQAIDLLASVELVVTNDTGLMHIAAALGTPLLALYGSSTPTFTPPMSARATIMKLDMACSPCFERTCPLGHFDCMNRMKPADVYSRVIALLDAQAPSGAAAASTA
jgi:heptosyltransferase-2